MTAPWAGRRMYASGPTGAGRQPSIADETESAKVGVSESAMWSTFLTRVLKSPG
ncbi:MAG: hypothetical protein SFV19_00300 [Rhodospirillaceae bacterium]|nr:hypothetical protein [Rhodospirillaceae bacterium]